MEELQLVLEGKLYALSQEKLVSVMRFLKIESAVVLGEAKRKTIQRIQTEIERQIAGEHGEALLLELQKIIMEDMPLLEDNEEEESEEDAGLLRAAKEEFENMQKAFQEMLELQEKKMKEAENKWLSLSKASSGGKPPPQAGAGIKIGPQNIIRIKDFKISGTITNEKNRLPYSSLNKQIESALQRGYSETDIVDGVINSVAPTLHLRSYLESIQSLSLSQLRIILRSHYCEKSASEAYKEQANCAQEANETSLNFVMRALKLRQQVLSSSQEPGSTIQYDENLVQSVFINTIETGLMDESIRTRLRPILQQQKLPDENLIREVNLAMSSENERMSKLGAKKKISKPINVNLGVENSAKQAGVEPKGKQDKILAAIEALQADVNLLKQSQNKPRAQTNQPSNQTNYGRKSACQTCISEGKEKQCQHCFICGSEEHFARGCKKSKFQGNRKQLGQGGAA